MILGVIAEATNVQTARYAGPALVVDVERLLAGEPVFDEARAFAIAHRAAAPLISIGMRRVTDPSRDTRP